MQIQLLPPLKLCISSMQYNGLRNFFTRLSRAASDILQGTDGNIYMNLTFWSQHDGIWRYSEIVLKIYINVLTLKLTEKIFNHRYNLFTFFNTLSVLIMAVVLKMAKSVWWIDSNLVMTHTTLHVTIKFANIFAEELVKFFWNYYIQKKIKIPKKYIDSSCQ